MGTHCPAALYWWHQLVVLISSPPAQCNQNRAHLQRLNNRDLTLEVGTSVIQPVNCVRDLGVHLDSELTMKTHISKVVSAWCKIRHVRRVVGQDITQQLVSAFVLSRLDYCNSLLSGLPRSTIQPLQRVMNAAVRVIMALSTRNHVKPALKQLHWLPIEQRISYITCISYAFLCTTSTPARLRNIWVTVSPRSLHPGIGTDSDRPTQLTQSSSVPSVPRTRTRFGERGFQYSGPAAWNSLPADLHDITDKNTFKKRLKTVLFECAYWLIITVLRRSWTVRIVAPYKSRCKVVIS